MRAGILGTGAVARALGSGFVGLGYDVRFGTRDPQSDQAKALVARVGAKATIGTFAEAAQFGDLVVLATLWKADHRTCSSVVTTRPRSTPCRTWNHAFKLLRK